MLGLIRKSRLTRAIETIKHYQQRVLEQEREIIRLDAVIERQRKELLDG